MAMTGGRAYLVREVKANYGKANWYIRLYVYVKEKSQSIENNSTVLSLGMYVDAEYNIGEWYEQSNPVGSYLGTSTSGANCITFSGRIPENTTKYWIVENKEVTVTHNTDGTKTVPIYWKWNVNSPWGQCVTPSGSFNYTITTIPRATQPTLSTERVNMGSSLVISMPRASSAFKHALTYVMGDKRKTFAERLDTTTTWTVPYDLAEAIPNAKSGTCTIYCDTWSGGTLIGTKSVNFTAVVPEDSATKPTISCATSPVPVITLGEDFDGLYIQGITKIKTEITAEGQFDASITDYYSTVTNTGETSSPWGDVYIHPVPVSSGQARVIYSVKDSRGISNRSEHYIDVLPYSGPSVIAAADERMVVCARCDENGTLLSSGTYLRIKAGKRYSKVEHEGKQLNRCWLSYRYKVSTSDAYSSWKPLIVRNNLEDDFVDVILDGVVTSTTTSYDVQIIAADDMGNSHTIPFEIPTDKVNFHEREGGDGAAFGKYNERPKALEIAEDWEIVVNGDRWKKLAYSSSVSASTAGVGGRAPANDGVYYRVENGNHVFVAFNCAATYAGNSITVNSEDIPAELRPARAGYAMCATGSRSIARVVVNAAGKVVIDWTQILSSAEVTSSSAIPWIDGYIDYFITP